MHIVCVIYVFCFFKESLLLSKVKKLLFIVSFTLDVGLKLVFL